MNTNDIAKLAAAYAGGTMTYEAVFERLGGDGQLMNQVLSVAAGLGMAGVAAKVADTAIDLGREIPIVGDAIECVDDILGDAIDLFKW